MSTMKNMETKLTGFPKIIEALKATLPNLTNMFSGLIGSMKAGFTVSQTLKVGLSGGVSAVHRLP